MFGMVGKVRGDGAGAREEGGPCIVESGRGGDGERYVLSGRIGPYSIAGVHVRIALIPAEGEAVTLRLHGVGRFCGRVSRVYGERIRISFESHASDVAELVRVPT